MTSLASLLETLTKSSHFKETLARNAPKTHKPRKVVILKPIVYTSWSTNQNTKRRKRSAEDDTTDTNILGNLELLKIMTSKTPRSLNFTSADEEVVTNPPEVSTTTETPVNRTEILNKDLKPEAIVVTEISGRPPANFTQVEEASAHYNPLVITPNENQTQPLVDEGYEEVDDPANLTDYDTGVPDFNISEYITPEIKYNDDESNDPDFQYYKLEETRPNTEGSSDETNDTGDSDTERVIAQTLKTVEDDNKFFNSYDQFDEKFGFDEPQMNDESDYEEQEESESHQKRQEESPPSPDEGQYEGFRYVFNREYEDFKKRVLESAHKPFNITLEFENGDGEEEDIEGNQRREDKESYGDQDDYDEVKEVKGNAKQEEHQDKEYDYEE